MSVNAHMYNDPVHEGIPTSKTDSGRKRFGSCCSNEKYNGSDRVTVTIFSSIIETKMFGFVIRCLGSCFGAHGSKVLGKNSHDACVLFA